MNYQHSLLRDLYDVSLSKIEEIRMNVLNEGAYGAKISGAGLGGSVIALIQEEKIGQEIINSCLSIGAKDGWISKVGDGVRVEPSQ
jgi:galactokinase